MKLMRSPHIRRSASLGPRRRALGLVLLLLAGSLQTGCVLLYKRAAEQTKTIESSADDLLLLAEVEKSVFRPGEAVIVYLTVSNTTEETIVVRGMSASTAPPGGIEGVVSFWYGRANSLRRLQRYPVVSTYEERQMASAETPTVEIEPGGTISRRFLLTRITPEPGTYRFQAHFDAYSIIRSQRLGKVFSNSLRYEVHGDMLFERDSKGLILLEEAIRVASARAPGDVQLVDAILIRDEGGFFKWWVNVDYANEAHEVSKAGYLIDAYRGHIWKEADPFPDSAKPVDTTTTVRRRLPPTENP